MAGSGAVDLAGVDPATVRAASLAGADLVDSAAEMAEEEGQEEPATR